MTTNNRHCFPGLHYFCVDVETSGLKVWDSYLLSVGIVVLDADGNVVDHLYERVDCRGLHESWFDESLPARTDTQKWWREQGEFAKLEAYMDRTLPRKHPSKVANLVRNLALTYGESWEERVVVASPVHFDWAWVDDLWRSSTLEDPFWYHGIDMWSLNHGAYAQSRKGANKGKLLLSHRHDTSKSDIPHHALADAFAVARDLSAYLPKDIIDMDAPTYEGYDEYLAEKAAIEAEVEEEVGDEAWENVTAVSQQSEES